MSSLTDTLKTTAVGFSGHLVSGWDMLPDIVSIGVGIMTMLYLAFKIVLTSQELKNARKE